MPESEVGWQTAFGVVLAEPPDGPLGTATLMDYGEPPGAAADVGVPTFAYALPVDDGWLVEETVLVSRPAIDPDRLVARLAARLERSPAELLADAIRTERVAIPMGAPPARSANDVMPFGAAAGMVNPTTGYSIAASLGAASGAATQIVGLLDEPGSLDASALDAVIWPASNRRTRALHDYGLSVLSHADADTTRSFFDTFFDLSADRWSAYLRIDAEPTAVMGSMLAMFRRADATLRLRLVRSNPRPFARVVWPRW